MNNQSTSTLDLETKTLATGIFPQANGTLLAMTLTQSKEFKTRKGAEAWLGQRGYNADGTRKS